MNKVQFDILVALEKGRTALSAQELTKSLGLDEKQVQEELEKLGAQGLVKENGITQFGVDALAPYKTKRAIFIAAGFGSRLRPVTLETPKPLVKVHGTRIIDTLIDGVMAAGIEEIYVVCGYLGEQFHQLKEKYPNIQLVTNPMYMECNNISSAYLMRDHLESAYVLEADLLVHNPAIFDKYMYHSAYLGIPVDETDDWYFKTNEAGIIRELGIGSTDCYRMLGISYWNKDDGARLVASLEEAFPLHKDEDWCYVPMVKYRDEYQVHVRVCADGDIQEIDHFEELCQVDPSYNAYRK